MSNNNVFPQAKLCISVNLNKVRKSYRKPKLKDLGDLRAITLGGSPGAGDSGAGASTELRSEAPPPTPGFPQPGGFPPLPDGASFPPGGSPNQ